MPFWKLTILSHADLLKRLTTSTTATGDLAVYFTVLAPTSKDTATSTRKYIVSALLGVRLMQLLKMLSFWMSSQLPALPLSFSVPIVLMTLPASSTCTSLTVLGSAGPLPAEPVPAADSGMCTISAEVSPLNSRSGASCGGAS